ncbi:glycoside hydrolase family 3 N-terminal domain-containing protein [Candidatus Soleaferrea massiliensis]|uniref:glycoside hydrolase family 3 N-terminal domain-containing protein n=1 Tax=Candidatus Soleaferrea massiliensis TaxID=1470354 RepID=UPI002A4E1E8F|nr:glycoside hydrolase family 3 N-terminal domain-containing protein [Candidatus Soleaferrea massiliensis]
MMRIEVNGAEHPASLTAVSTGGWEIFKDLSPVYLRLEAGENTIRFSDKLGKLPNFDYYTLERVGDELPEGHLVRNKGSSVVEAEDYLDAHENFVIQTPTVNGVQITTIGNQNIPGAWITYELYALEAGDYQISFCMANGVQPYSDFMRLYVNNIDQDVHLDMPQTGDGQGAAEWFNFIDMPKVNVTLPKGRSVLRIVPNVVSFPNMDYMTISPKPLVDPIKIEAEDWSAGHENLLLEHPVINGVQHTTLAKVDTDQLWVEYTIDSPMEGDWFFILNAASAYDPIKNFMKIYVGDELQEAQLDMPTTGNRDAGQWWNFIDLPAVRVRLPRGTCKLKFVTNQSAFPNLDYFVLEKAADDILKPPETEKPDPEEPQKPDPYILEDVANGVITMDAFIAQLSDDDLAWLANGHGAGIPGGTGTIGNMGAYGIPGANTCDGPAGIRLTESCTAWPCATLLACTFNTGLVEEVGRAAGTEAAINGGDIWLAPAMNIHRNPLCGRNFEYYSEDPLLSGKTGAALTNGVQSTGVFVTLKHFAANNKETNRKEGDSRMSERALREIYLKGFEIAVKEGHPGCIMSSYNRINGQFASACRELLTGILRDEWGFDGIVMTDWVTSTKLPEEIKAGNNVKMPNAFDDSFVAVREALASGELTREEMEENAKSILELVMRTLAFEKVTQGVQTQEISGAETTRIEAESFVWKSDRINVESCADSPGEVNIGTLYPGEWATYDVTVRQAGTYRMVFRIATTSSTGGAFDIYMDKDLAGSYSNNGTYTGAWQNWATAEPFTVTLPAGRHTMKVACTRAGSNLNWFELTPIEVEAPVGMGIRADGLRIDEEKGIISGAAFGDDVSSVLNRLSAEDERAGLRIAGQDGSGVPAGAAARTGMKVQLTYAGIVLREFDLSVIGDLGLSDQPGVQTLLAIKAHILGRSPLSGLQAASADVYAEGQINIFDLVQLKLMILRGF